MFCCLELVSCRLAVATDCRLELQHVVTYIYQVEVCMYIFFKGRAIYYQVGGGGTFMGAGSEIFLAIYWGSGRWN